MNRIVNHLVNEFVVKALARNKTFQSAVVRTVDSFKGAADKVSGAAGDAAAATPKTARTQGKIKPEIPENMAEAPHPERAPKPAADPRDKGFFGHLSDVVKQDVSDMFGRR
ncbi:hypothetical protein FNF31_01200 [Cafeteria roenbergensis]|uniref:Uncharacterized protein n=1 Tax=Cafeteria roenbergensis TaxID=33653 RepID=A0A5A8D766_CAFRO|nr:hypothetical protein FNF28_05125 [Cafeteria roenbergensis]KAA0166825.1 hypothetical protein FNF31_01200 [Cafeteria roenbergensis]